MFARLGRWVGAASGSICLIFVVQAAAVAAPADEAVRLSLDTAYTGAVGKIVSDEPASLRDCVSVPGGAKPDTDGWRFDQPIAGGSVAAYTIAFIATTNGKLSPILLGVTPSGVIQIDFTPETLQGHFTSGDIHPAPEGVAGGFVDEGNRGVWLGTPRGWRLATGALLVAGAASDTTTFSLTAVCLPASASPSTSASPSRSASPSSSPSSSASVAAVATPTASASPAPAGAGLAVTGTRTAGLALVGLLAAALGALMVAIRRRRDKIRFEA